jgi:DNA invertase Pin-like site-specific DNA recombinase
VDKKDSISIESQFEFCRHELKGGSFKEYADKGFSGKNTDRPQFQALLCDIKTGLIKRVVVYKLDRISRSILDFSKMMELFQEYNVEFISSSEKFDTSTPMGRAMLNICIVFAELERETIQQRVTDAYISRSRMGFYMGGRIPYGFKHEPVVINGINTSQYVPVAEEIEHMKTIYGIYSKPATSVSDVVKYFRENGIEKKRGAEWSTPRISEVLKNPIYVRADIEIYNFYFSRGTEIVNPPESFIGENGCYLYTKDVSRIGKMKDMAQYDNMVLVIAPHKGVVDSDVWIKCRLKGERNAQIPNARRQYKTWLSGKLKCGVCGYALRYNKWKGKTVKNEYFMCSEVYGNRRCKGFGMVRVSRIHSEILKLIEDKVAEIRIEQTQPSANLIEINALRASIASKEKEIETLLDNFEGGSEAVMRRLNKRVDEIEEEILSFKNEILKLEMNKSSRTQLDTGMIGEIFKLWDRVPIEEQQAVADTLIKKVLVTDKTIEIEWKV